MILRRESKYQYCFFLMANSTSLIRYQGMDNLPATMTLGRRGHYAGLRNSGAVRGANHDDHSAGNTTALLGGGGQYATLSKQCKTLESSDFY